MHVKDVIKAQMNGLDHYESTILGKGLIDVKSIVKYARKREELFTSSSNRKPTRV